MPVSGLKAVIRSARAGKHIQSQARHNTIYCLTSYVSGMGDSSALSQNEITPNSHLRARGVLAVTQQLGIVVGFATERGWCRGC